MSSPDPADIAARTTTLTTEIAALNTQIARSRASGRMTKLLALGEAVILAALAIGFVLWTHRPRPFDPLILPEQKTDALMYHLTDTVKVTATKCNVSKKTVYVMTSSFWNQRVPLGTSFPQTVRALGTAAPGCVTSTFIHVIPPAVITATEALFAQGVHPVWRLGGFETPVGHANAVTSGWVTNDFTLVP